LLQPRSYQTKALTDLRQEFKNGLRRLLLRAPTGAGKTIIACLLIKSAVAKGTKVLFMAHRTELIEQCSKKLGEMGIYHGIIKRGYPLQLSAPVQVASVQTLVRRQGVPEPGLIFVDEAHHAVANTYKTILDRFPNAIVIGLTATPARPDGKGLGGVFQKIIHTIDYWDLLEQGFLVPMRLLEPSIPDMSKVKTTAGDFNKGQKAERMRSARIYGDIVRTWQEHAVGKPTLMFAASVAHSLELCAMFRQNGIIAKHVDGTTDPDVRKKLFAEIQDGSIDILSNVGIATEGTDLPAVSCVLLANPTKSIVLFHQMVGRGLRPHPESGKECLLILDHAGNHSRLGTIADDIEWTLDGRAERRRGGEDNTPGVRMCPACYLAVKSGTMECPSCGHVWVIEGRKPEQEEAEMVDATENSFGKIYRSRYDPLTFYCKKIIQGKENKYSWKWASVQFKIVFQEWPRFHKSEVNQKLKELAA